MTLADVHLYLDDIDPNSYEYWCSQDEAPTLPEVKHFFAGIKFQCPSEFAEFATSRLNGLHFRVREEVWPRKKGGAHWWFLYGISVFGIGPEIPDWLDLRIQMQQFQLDGISNLLPFMRVISDADRYCFTPEGQIVHWSHETNETTVINQTFAECLLRELHVLEERRERVALGAIPK